MAKSFPQGQVLDIGPVGSYGEPFLHLTLRRQNPGLKLIGVDQDLKGLLQCHLPNALAADGLALPFKNSSFDGVLCLEVLEHLHQPLRLILECWRVLRDGSELIITTPNAWALWNVVRHWMFGTLASRTHRQIYRRYLGDPDHKLFFDPLSLMNLLDDAGFEPITITTKNHAIPGLRRWFRSLGMLDWQCYPVNRMGNYLCIVSKKTHLP